MTTDHPNGPRTIVTMIRDNVPVPPPVLERMRALEAGRHPTLTELRRRLGLDLDISRWVAAARSVAPAAGAIPTDEDLSAVIDASYRALSSTRLIRVEITEAGPQASRAHEPIRIRDDEELWLLVFADNTLDRGVEFSAEAHGEGFGGYVEPRRTGSSLLSVGQMHRGSYLLPLLIAAEGRPTTIDLPIECTPSGMLRVHIVDDATGERTAARVYLTDAAGAPAPEGAHLRRDRTGAGFFHADGSFEARVSGRVNLTVARGIEYEAAELQVEVPPDAERDVEARLRRWCDMKAEGWRSGDVHVHMHYGGEYLLEPEDVALAQRAEDVHFLNMMVANQGSGWVHDRERFTGAPHDASTPDYVLQWGEEYRNNFYGHMCMFGIGELVPPIYSGFPISEHSHDLPANAEAADHCHRVGGTLSYAHPMFDSVELDRVFREEDVHSVEAKELPVDAALGKIDAIDVMSYPGDELQTCELWYRLLNCGIALAATAGTDTFMNVADGGEFSNPPAGDRVYARVDGEFSVPSWCEAVRAGRTFVTNGPVIALDVAGSAPGDRIAAKAGATLRVRATSRSFVPVGRMEIIVNGAVVASAAAADDGRSAEVEHELTPSGSCWVAARALGPEHPLALDSYVFAHTSPVYVAVDAQPIADAASARYFVEWIDRLCEMAERRGRYPSPAERDAVIALFRDGQAYFRALIS